MNTPLTMLLLLVLTTFTSPGPSVNGLKIVTRQVTGDFTDTRTEYLAADRLRNEWHSQMRDRIGLPMATIILRGEHDRIFVLDLQAHEYTSYEGRSRGAALGIKPRPMIDSGGTLQIWIENIDTGERKDIFGHMARHIITREKRVAGPGACSKPSQSETDGWYIAGSDLPEWRQQKGNGGVVVAAEVAAGSNDKCANKIDKIEVHRKGMETGFPIKVTTTLRSEVTEPDGTPRIFSSTWGSEVIELQEGPLELSLFEVPKDFKRVEVLRSWNVPPPRLQTNWEWFKEKVQEFFR
ncbi:MAG TPA: hypothetical protein VE133_11090 [Candidatus Sulfotelmatobacter sp.]|nr:hypothetical protein [Candidatus Sulfotelmatobacter sp.]